MCLSLVFAVASLVPIAEPLNSDGVLCPQSEGVRNQSVQGAFCDPVAAIRGFGMSCLPVPLVLERGVLTLPARVPMLFEVQW